MRLLLALLLCAFAHAHAHAHPHPHPHTSDAADPQRPQYHFLPPSNWMNDPNGPLYFNGIYHLFYQYNPNAPVWGDMHWGHAMSKDLVHWTYLPIALAPTPGSYDQNGIFSGSITPTGNPKNPLVLVYTGISPNNSESQCLAFPQNIADPTLTNWTKFQGNPVIPGPPANVGPTSGFRDPTTAWNVNGVWNLIIGSGVGGKQGMVLLYQSKDLNTWTFVQPLYSEANSPVTGDMWECPDFYQVSPDLWVLKFSGAGRDMWRTGKYVTANNTFVPEGPLGEYDFGRFYASKTFWDPSKNRRILFGWVAEEDNNATARGWASIQSLPRVITIDANTMFLKSEPIPELTSLRTTNNTWSSVTIGNGQTLPLTGLPGGDQVEILLTFEEIDPAVTTFGLLVRASNQEYTNITYNMGTPVATPEIDIDRPGADYHYHTLSTLSPADCITFCDQDPLCQAWTVYSANGVPTCTLKNSIPNTNPKVGCTSGVRSNVNIDMSKSSLASDTNRGARSAPAIGDPHSLRIYIDHSAIEIYVNEGSSVMTSRVYPTLPQSQEISLFSIGGSTTVSVNVWQLASAWN